jgi:hypothetical protein
MRLTLGTLLLGGLLSLGGCHFFVSPQATEIAQGRYYSSGNPDYDEFFLRVYRLQIELKEGPAKMERLVSDLQAKLGLPARSAASELQAALTTKLKSLGSKGITLRLERDVGGGMQLVRAGTATGADATLLDTLGQAVTAIDAVRDGIARWQRDLDALPPRAIELDRGADKAFWLEGRSKRSEVRENLADAQKVMGLMRSILKDVDTRSEELSGVVSGVLGASTPTPAPAPEPQTESEAPETPRPRASPPRRAPASGAKPAGDAAPPAPPKPAQGTAKPDFEP